MRRTNTIGRRGRRRELVLVRIAARHVLDALNMPQIPLHDKGLRKQHGLYNAYNCFEPFLVTEQCLESSDKPLYTGAVLSDLRKIDSMKATHLVHQARRDDMGHHKFPMVSVAFKLPTAAEINIPKDEYEEVLLLAAHVRLNDTVQHHIRCKGQPKGKNQLWHTKRQWN